MKKNFIEVIVGFIVVILFIAVVFYALQRQSNGRALSNSYTIQAVFSNAVGITTGTEVMVSGVRVGKVTAQSLDKSSYGALISMSLQDDIKVPLDSTARILSNGLLGGKYISLDPGIDDVYLQNGDTITLTQSSLSFEEMLSKLLFGLSNKEGAKEDNDNSTQELNNS